MTPVQIWASPLAQRAGTQEESNTNKTTIITLLAAIPLAGCLSTDDQNDHEREVIESGDNLAISKMYHGKCQYYLANDMQSAAHACVIADFYLHLYEFEMNGGAKPERRFP